MKEHTFTFSGKGFAGVIALMAGGGLLLFGVGFLIGYALHPASAHGGSGVDAAAASIASNADANAAVTGGTAWPFGVPAPASGPAPTPTPTPGATDSAPAAPAPSTPAPAPAVKPKTSSGLQTVAYVASSDQDNASDARDTDKYIIQVGSFRSERNASQLASRLEAAGYHPNIVVRDDDGRPLHVVRLARVTGRARAQRAAEAIGDAEGLVATVVAERHAN